jgi:metacaspase-1
MLSTGLALRIGPSSVPSHYVGGSGELNACDAGADDMTDIAISQEFKVTTLLTRHATREQVIGRISKATKALKAGEILYVVTLVIILCVSLLRIIKKILPIEVSE